MSGQVFGPMGVLPASGGGGGFTTLNPSDKTASLALSGGNALAPVESITAARKIED